MSAPAPLAVRLLASSALVLVSGGYALWQPGRAPKPVLRKMGKAVKAPAAIVTAAAPVPAEKIALAETPVHVRPPKAAAERPAPVAPYEPLYADGDFIGAPFDSDFGPLQVEVTITGGRIVAMNLLQVPDHRERSAEISAEVIPILVQEAIQAQSSRIDIVASATYTTAAFADALYNALSKAQKN